nr:hypothetical protein [Pandoravirus aubagnensis]
MKEEGKKALAVPSAPEGHAPDTSRERPCDLHAPALAEMRETKRKKNTKSDKGRSSKEARRRDIGACALFFLLEKKKGDMGIAQRPVCLCMQNKDGWGAMGRRPSFLHPS